MTSSGTALSLRGRRLLWLIVGGGLLLRLAIAFVADTTSWVDLDSLAVVREDLRTHDVLDFYSDVPDLRWPYPPGYLSAVAVYDRLSEWTGLHYANLVRVGPSLVDAGLALVVQHILGQRGAREWMRLAAAAAVSLGPVFVGVAAYQAQIDAVAILPALAAFAVWERGGDRRALAAGLLIGAGASIKSVPILMVLALAPSVRSRRELVTLAAAAVAVPAVIFAPFLTAGLGDVIDHLTYRGFPGLGGLSLLVQPDLPLSSLAGHPFDLNAASDVLSDYGGVIIATGLLAVALTIARLRPQPLDAAVLIWLTLWLTGVNFFLQYLVWGLPFLLARGDLRRAVAIQLLATPALLVQYLDVSTEWLVWAGYTAPLIAIWILSAVTLVSLVRECAQRPAARASPARSTS